MSRPFSRFIDRMPRSALWTISLGAWLTGLYACVGDDPIVVPSSSMNDGGAGIPPSEDAATDASSVVDSGPTRFCRSHVAPPGTDDFFCADFDGEEVTEGFPTVNADGGAPARATDVFSSSPASLALSGARLDWGAASDKPFSEFDVRFRLRVDPTIGSPAKANGFMSLVRLGIADTQVELMYGREAPINGVAHTGYALRRSNAASANVKPIASPIPSEQWISIRIDWTNGGTATVYFNDVQVVSDTAVVPNTTSPNVRLSVGLTALGQAPQVARHTIDDLLLSVRR